MKSNKRFVALFILLTLVMALVVMVFAGCKSLKTLSRHDDDSTSVKTSTINKTDSSGGGGIKKTDEKTKEEFEWWKVIIPGRDTTINNIYTQPIIYEGGRGTRDTEKQSVDSSFYFNIIKLLADQRDSTRKISSDLETSKIVKPSWLSIPTMLIMIIGSMLLIEFVKHFSKNYTIIKKSKS